MSWLIALTTLTLAGVAGSTDSCTFVSPTNDAPPITSVYVSGCTNSGSALQAAVATASLSPLSAHSTKGAVSIMDISLGENIVGITFSLSHLTSGQSSGKIEVQDGGDCANLGPSYYNPSVGPDPWDVVLWRADTSGAATGFTALSLGWNTAKFVGKTVVVYGGSVPVACGVLTLTDGAASASSDDDTPNTWYYVAIMVLSLLGAVGCVLCGLWLFVYRKPSLSQDELRSQQLRDGKIMMVDSRESTGFSRVNTREFKGGRSSRGRDSVRSGVSVRLSDADNMLDSCEGVVVVDHSVCTTVRTLPPRTMVGTAPAERISQTKKYTPVSTMA